MSCGCCLEGTTPVKIEMFLHRTKVIRWKYLALTLLFCYADIYSITEAPDPLIVGISEAFTLLVCASHALTCNVYSEG